MAIEITELDPELFTWYNWENDYGARLDLDYGASLDLGVMRREIAKRIVGYCDGGRLQVRPKSDMYGIMLEDDDHERFWFHFPKNAFDEIVGKAIDIPR